MKNDTIIIDAGQTSRGITIFVDKKKFTIGYSPMIWKQTPPSIKRFLVDNLAYAETHLLPVLLNKPRIEYKTAYPFFESLFYRNQLFDMLYSEDIDNVQQLTYLKPFYNLDIYFRSRDVFVPQVAPLKQISNSPTALLPFTLGKESLVTAGLCEELGIKPVLIFCQEPSQVYEEKKKLSFMYEFQKTVKADFHFIEHEPGLFRYGKAFNLPFGSELGWGTQTTLLALLFTPFMYKYKASYVFMGSEYSNNYYYIARGWRIYCSYDQSTHWTPQQSMITQFLTGDTTKVHSMLEPLEELTIFYVLHNRYPHYSRFQFSCFANDPLVGMSQWCHTCSKCFKNYLFALATGVDPSRIGFQLSMLTPIHIKKYYLALLQDAEIDMDFAMKILIKKKHPELPSELIPALKKHLRGWKKYEDHFFNLKSTYNLPQKYRSKIVGILSKELENFRNSL